MVDVEGTTVRTKCPNCGLEYNAQKPDGKPPFFSIRHPNPNPMPDVIPEGMYWCGKCKALHRLTSKKGIRHLKHHFVIT